MDPQDRLHLVRNLLAMAEEVRAEMVAVYSDSSEIHALAEEKAFRAFHASIPDPSDHFLPIGMDYALHHSMMTWPGKTIAAVDVHNPGIGPNTINRAIKALGNEKEGCVVSMSTPADHPCQFKRFFRQIDVQIAGLPSQNSCDENGTIPTRPFAFDWNQTVVPGREDSKGESWIRESDTQASIVYTPGKNPPEAFLWNNSAIVNAVHQDEDGDIAFTIDSTKEPLRIFVYPLASEKLGEDGPPVITIDCDGGETLTFPANNEPGFVFQIFRDVIEGEYDFEEVATPGGAPWDADMLGRIINRKTKMIISGRQHFPPIHCADASLVCVRGDAQTLLTSMEDSSFIPFFLRQNEQRLIKNTLDLLLLGREGGITK
ncbi:hypothetical protein OAN24_01600 [Pseudodesulfovibrio sp.]|nr:hypothetical protein [Pseudodesulfovibrio sp.]